jgi:hypothetical protein
MRSSCLSGPAVAVLPRGGTPRRDVCLRATTLGPFGWHILGAATAIGTTVLWWATERVFGTFWR